MDDKQDDDSDCCGFYNWIGYIFTAVVWGYNNLFLGNLKLNLQAFVETCHFISDAVNFLVTTAIFQLFSFVEYLRPLLLASRSSDSVCVNSGLITNINFNNFNSSGGTTIETRMFSALIVAIALSLLARTTNARRKSLRLIIWRFLILVGIMICLLISWNYRGKADFISFTLESGSKFLALPWGTSLIALSFIFAYSQGFSILRKLRSKETVIDKDHSRLSLRKAVLQSAAVIVYTYGLQEQKSPNFLAAAHFITIIILGIMFFQFTPTPRWKVGLWQDSVMRIVRIDYVVKLVGYDSAWKGKKVREANLLPLLNIATIISL